SSVGEVATGFRSSFLAWHQSFSQPVLNGVSKPLQALNQLVRIDRRGISVFVFPSNRFAGNVSAGRKHRMHPSRSQFDNHPLGFALERLRLYLRRDTVNPVGPRLT